MKTLLSLIFIAAFLVSAQAKRLEVLFLGDEGHHKPCLLYTSDAADE